MILADASASLIAPLLATAAMATACATLSVFVVARRWAFIGEGIGHSGFGGAGLAWLLVLIAPSLTSVAWLPYASVVVFCLGTALAIGYISRGNRIAGDAAIGIFLVASLAFGFLAREIYRHFNHREPADFEAVLFGNISAIDPRMALVAIMVCAAVLATLFALGKEILAYCFDPVLAEASGVRAGFIHYLLMTLIAVTIIVGIPLTGAPLVTALLVLPGVTAAMLSGRFSTVLTIAIATALLSAVAGVVINATWRFIPLGPAIVLTLFAQFLVAYFATRFRSASTT